MCHRSYHEGGCLIIQSMFVVLRGATHFAFSLFVILPWLKKLRIKKPLGYRKEGGLLKAKRPLPPLFPTPHMEAELGCNNDELTLKDMMTAMGSINSRLAEHESRLDEIARPNVPLPAIEDQKPGMGWATLETHDVSTHVQGMFNGMEEAVHLNIANRLRGTSPVYVAQVDEE